MIVLLKLRNQTLMLFHLEQALIYISLFVQFSTSSKAFVLESKQLADKHVLY